MRSGNILIHTHMQYDLAGLECLLFYCTLLIADKHLFTTNLNLDTFAQRIGMSFLMNIEN